MGSVGGPVSLEASVDAFRVRFFSPSTAAFDLIVWFTGEKELFARVCVCVRVCNSKE